MASYVIAYSGDRPPFLCPPPCDYRGQLWRYVEATPQNAAEALAVHERDFADWPPDEELVRLAARSHVPTRAGHEREEREVIRRIMDRFPWLRHLDQDQYVVERVAARASERHNYRVSLCRAACRAAVNRLWPDEEVARSIPEATIAILSLYGQGGPGDLGGPEGASVLPLIRDPLVIHFRAESGPAWCAALARVAEGWRIVIDATDGSIVVENGAESCLLWRPGEGMELHSEVRAALRRVILGPGQVIPDATWRVHREWRAPQDISPEDDMRLRTALALLVCPPVAPAQVAVASEEDRDGE
jgi:hypothetical protein